MAVPKPTRIVTFTALNEKNEGAAETTIYLERLQVDGEDIDLQCPADGQWTERDNKKPGWFAPDDERRTEGQTDSISYQIAVADKTELTFWENRWKGKVLIPVGTAGTRAAALLLRSQGQEWP